MCSTSSPKKKALTYLPHLDGLRTVALLGVLLFHFEVAHFQGGFVGVDIFLTLSGYLITRNLLNDAANSTFTLRSFYVRRFFRLYPASSAVVLLTVLTAFMCFSPVLTDEICRSALASQFFASNVFFYMKANYFEKTALVRPLLHTWSLSLEEHFYFLWAPFLKLVFTIRNIKSQMLVVVMLTFCSFCYACYINSRDYSLAFYMIPSRAYQFTVGALLAFFQRWRSLSAPAAFDGGILWNADRKKSDLENEYRTNDPKLISSRHFTLSACALKWPTPSSVCTNTIAFLSLVVLFSSYVLLPKAPSPLAALPIAIATTIIIQTENSILSKFLSSRIMVFVGSLTYSAYLVHWPVWVYSRYMLLIMDVDGLWKPNPIVVTAITLFFAALLRFFVEQPLRQGHRRAQYLVALLFMVTVGTAAYGVHTFGFWFRTSGKVNTIERTRHDLTARGLPIFLPDGCQNYENFITDGDRTTKVACLTGSKTGPIVDNFLVVGNSFAGMLLPALHVIGVKRDIRIAISYGVRCELRARNRLHLVDDVGVYTCKKTISGLWDRIESMPKNSTVFFSLFWGLSSKREACEELQEIDNALDRLGLNGVIFPEPPGVHPRYERFYNCVDSLKLPIAGFLRWWGRRQNWEHMGSCGPDIRNGVEPSAGMLQYEQYYHQCTDLKRLKVLVLADRICKNVGKKDSFRWLKTPKRCQFPNSSFIPHDIDDFGYERALFHISPFGAYRLESILEEFMAPYLP